MPSELHKYLEMVDKPFTQGIIVKGKSVYGKVNGEEVKLGELSDETFASLYLLSTKYDVSLYEGIVVTEADDHLRVNWRVLTYTIMVAVEELALLVDSHISWLKKTLGYGHRQPLPIVLCRDTLTRYINDFVNTVNKDYPGFFNENCKLTLFEKPQITRHIALKVTGDAACRGRVKELFSLGESLVAEFKFVNVGNYMLVVLRLPSW